MRLTEVLDGIAGREGVALLLAVAGGGKFEDAVLGHLRESFLGEFLQVVGLLVDAERNALEGVLGDGLVVEVGLQAGLVPLVGLLSLVVDLAEEGGVVEPVGAEHAAALGLRAAEAAVVVLGVVEVAVALLVDEHLAHLVLELVEAVDAAVAVVLAVLAIDAVRVLAVLSPLVVEHAVGFAADRSVVHLLVETGLPGVHPLWVRWVAESERAERGKEKDCFHFNYIRYDARLLLYSVR